MELVNCQAGENCLVSPPDKYHKVAHANRFHGTALLPTYPEGGIILGMWRRAKKKNPSLVTAECYVMQLLADRRCRISSAHLSVQSCSFQRLPSGGKLVVWEDVADGFDWLKRRKPGLWLSECGGETGRGLMS